MNNCNQTTSLKLRQISTVLNLRNLLNNEQCVTLCTVHALNIYEGILLESDPSYVGIEISEMVVI